MTDNLDAVLADIQEKCDQTAHEMFTDDVANRWKNPIYAQIMEQSDANGEIKGSCGDLIRIYLKIDKNMIKDARFYTTGCGASIVTADLCCELCIGKTTDQASEISGEDILKVAGRIPIDKEHCAHLASSALQEALCNWIEKTKTIS